MEPRLADGEAFHRNGAFAVAARACALGALAGISHAIAEATLAAMSGVALRWTDVLLIAAQHLALGVAGLGGSVALLGMAGRLIGSLSAPLRTGRLDRSGVLVLVFGYAAAGIWQIADHASGMRFAAIALPYTTLLLAVVALTPTRLRRPGTFVAACLTLAFAGVGATRAATLLPDIAMEPMRLAFGAAVCVPPALGLVTLAFLSRREGERGVPIWTETRWLLFAVPLLIASSAVFIRLEIPWQLIRQPLAPAPDATNRPNVLLVVLDTVRAESLDLFGYSRKTMPRLAGFAKECDYAGKMQANSAATLETHASMFTGRFPSSHGAHEPSLNDNAPPTYGYFLPEGIPTLAELLGNAGYRTGGIAGNFGVLKSYGLGRGFAHYDVRRSDAAEIERISWLYTFSIRGRSLGTALRYRLPKAVAAWTPAFDQWLPNYRTAAVVSERALAWLESGDGRPFFLFLNYMDAHQPYLPPRDLRNRFGADELEVDWIGFPHAKNQAWLWEGEPIPERDLEHARSLYDAELYYLDQQLERLLLGLRNLGLLDDTLIFIVGDHGEAFGEHGVMRHGSNLYEAQVSVPLLIKLPASFRGHATEVVPDIQHLDFLPTVAAVLGLEAPTGMQGAAFGAGRGYALSETFVHYRGHPKYHRELVAVRIGGHKFIRSSSGEIELYDLVADPGETNNLAGTLPELEERFRALVRQRDGWIPQRTEMGEEGKALIDRLRALGYVE